MKRADVPTELVLRTIAEHQFNAWERALRAVPAEDRGRRTHA